MQADLRSSMALDQATGELESSRRLALCCSRCLPLHRHRLDWAL